MKSAVIGFWNRFALSGFCMSTSAQSDPIIPVDRRCLQTALTAGCRKRPTGISVSLATDFVSDVTDARPSTIRYTRAEKRPAIIGRARIDRIGGSNPPTRSASIRAIERNRQRMLRQTNKRIPARSIRLRESVNNNTNTNITKRRSCRPANNRCSYFCESENGRCYLPDERT